ncbi:GTP 3',8-cyclase MoaA [Bartonella sp. HY038]|uniref:GTP 3',8-cyclase MoaA n=1 Tax=Bartonella sp. HY038 TaxID=2759660 RepID=UPI0015F99DCC|nr:GTP 3',8-cyclase MoaA [Bartonella sp. HY038]
MLDTVKNNKSALKPSQLQDGFGRNVSYLRLSVTDRCDLRCVYCMSEDMVFLPKKELLTVEELYRVSSTMINLGIKKIRLTGGEPLVRRGIMQLFAMLSPHIGKDLEELTLTTNGTLLDRHAGELASLGVKRVNISLDTLNPARYEDITRLGDIAKVFRGIDAALEAGLKVKINTVAMNGHFLSEVDELIRFAHARNMDLTLIEEMPLGYTGHDRVETHLSLTKLRESLSQRWTLNSSAKSSGGPARYVTVEETGGQLGFITPLSCDFCANCNRVRIGSTGRLYPCMGQTGMVELREVLRSSEANEHLIEKIYSAIAGKPKGHNFLIEKDKVFGIARHMSELGG